MLALLITAADRGQGIKLCHKCFLSLSLSSLWLSIWRVWNLWLHGWDLQGTWEETPWFPL